METELLPRKYHNDLVDVNYTHRNSGLYDESNMTRSSVKYKIKKLLKLEIQIKNLKLFINFINILGKIYYIGIYIIYIYTNIYIHVCI